MSDSVARANYRTYRRAMLKRLVRFRKVYFSGQDELFDPEREHVFRREHAHCNLFDPVLDRWLPHDRRHTWFASMGSSQALTVSVLGLMLERGNLSLLHQVPDEQGLPLLPGFEPAGKPEFDYRVTVLHESRSPTQVDLYLPGQGGHVAIECKLWEDRLSPCSQVSSKQCNGRYTQQPGLASGERCALTKKAITYWRHIPQLFTWPADQDYPTCPIWKPYQLVRNVLAAAVDPATEDVWGQPVTALVYDANNPACGAGGPIDEQYQAVKGALRGPASLKRTSWQAITGVLAAKGGYEGLLVWLEEKYGIVP